MVPVNAVVAVAVAGVQNRCGTILLTDRELRRQDCGYLTYLGDDVPQLMHDVKAVLGHHIGTTRMAADPAQGVVDEHCRVYGVDNLFVASSSVFPTSSHANPTLTIVAMAVRLADYLKGILPAA